MDRDRPKEEKWERVGKERVELCPTIHHCTNWSKLWNLTSVCVCVWDKGNGTVLWMPKPPMAVGGCVRGSVNAHSRGITWSTCWSRVFSQPLRNMSKSILIHQDKLPIFRFLHQIKCTRHLMVHQYIYIAYDDISALFKCLASADTLSCLADVFVGVVHLLRQHWECQRPSTQNSHSLSLLVYCLCLNKWLYRTDKQGK